MSDTISVLQEIGDYAKMTGLSVGMLIACAALFYFFASARVQAIVIAAIVIGAYGEFIYVDHRARAEVQAAWAAADAKAAEAAKARDAGAGKTIATQYDPIIADRDKTIASLTSQVQSYEKQLAAKKGVACPLGADALRLRQRKARK